MSKFVRVSVREQTRESGYWCKDRLRRFGRCAGHSPDFIRQKRGHSLPAGFSGRFDL